MDNGIISTLGNVFILVASIGLLWFASVRLIGRGVPFVNPETYIPNALTTPIIQTDTPKAQRERRLPLRGAANFRDLGGYQTTEGRHVRWDLVYRSEALGHLTHSDLAYLNDIGLRLICDLRTPGEITRVPDRLPQTARWLATPVQEGDFDKSMLPMLLFNRKILPDLMRQSYPKLLAENAYLFGNVLKLFADAENLPAVFHCTAGKDRAGLMSALLLGTLGVPEKTIIEDYTLSNLAFKRLFSIFVKDNRTSLGRLGIPMKELHPMLIADPVWMEGALTFIRETYGSINAYLTDAAGVETAVLDRIRENLLA